jgi:transposase-like protein
MVTQVLHCPHCHGTDMVRHGTTRHGTQRSRCRVCPDRGRTFLLDEAYAGPSPDVKRQSVEMALHASGLRETARVWRVSPTTVMKDLKKRTLTCTQCIRRCCGRCTQSMSRSKSVAPTSWHNAAG